jgi:hypothetical protein
MKRYFAILLLLIFAGVVTAEAAARTETVRVQINHQKRLPKSRLTVRFVELIEDSRCPIDTTCVWAGNAKIKVRVSRNGRPQDVTLETNGPDKPVVVDGYTIKLVGLTPQPRSNIRINRNGYVATISVTK